MNFQEFDGFLERSLADDDRLGRSERDDLRERLTAAELDPDDLAALRNRTFAFLQRRLRDRPDTPAAVAASWVGWAGHIVKQLWPAGTDEGESEALFSPGEVCWQRIVGLLASSRECVDICVFTITDNRISDAILDAHRRGVRVRVISDNDKATDLGSDVDRLAREGVPVAVDRSDKHMHHKFALFDRKQVLTGSYNWTRSAAQYNQENIVVTNDVDLGRGFQGEFDQLWARFFSE